MILESIIGWAVPFILGTVVTGIISHIKNTVSKDKKKDKAIENAVQALLRNELIRRFREYKTKGEMSMLDKENMDHMFTEYFNLGGNGLMKEVHSEFLEIPIKVVK